MNFSCNVKNGVSLALPLALGVLAFFLIVGPRALNPVNIAWLGSGDPATYYLGWLFYRNSPWEFPLGLNPSYGLELANSIVFSDSNPLLAFLFKPFSALLPETFQYFGIWLLICFVLQAWFGWKLVALTTDSKLLRFFGAGLIVFSPPMILRVSGHLSLAGHFLIVAALYLAFSSDLRRRKMAWGLLVGLTSLVHAYLLAMVFAIWAVDLFGRMIKSQISARNSIVELVTIAAVVVLVCWQAGYFSVGAGTRSSGYGFFRMNLLSVIDSSDWSYVLKDIPQAAGDYEGFNYLGLGIIFLFVLSLPGFFSKNRHLLVLFILLALFAASNSVAIGSFEFKYPLPNFALDLFNIFRASGRMFWPVFYVIIFFLIHFTIKQFDQRTAAAVLGLALVAQIVDTSVGWLPIRKNLMATPSDVWSSSLVNQFWHDASIKYEKIRYIPVGNNSSEWKTFAYFASQHNLSTDAVYLARVSTHSLEGAQRKASEILSADNYDQDSLYILDDRSFRRALINGNRDTDLFARIDGFNVVAPGWKKCSECRSIVDEINISDFNDPPVLGERVLFNDVGRGVNYLANGWSTPEPWGTWSDGSASVLFFPIEPGKVGSVSIEFNALISSAHPLQRIEIFFNGVLTTSLTVRKPTTIAEIKLTEPTKSKSLSGLKVEFRLPDAASPRDIGLGDDGRTLALGLKAITLQ
ncbi:MAG: DUF6311 domain-containing protein [Candidatus Thiodiazotropha sp.]